MTHTARADGYVTDTTYADRFYRELSPVWLNYVAALNGTAPRPLERPFAYLELGCGFGTSTVVQAGAFPDGTFHACDLNPVHIAGGRRLAGALGVDNVVFHEAAFDALDVAALPAFDFVVLHGVYSWVGAAAREAVRRIIHATLRPGGLVYVSYNCLPGWASEVPLRRLLVELCASESGPTGARAERARAALKRLSDGRLRYFSATPAATAAVDSYLANSTGYLVHEFLNETWEPFYSIDVADELDGIGLSYAGSATLADNHAALILNEPAAQAVASLPTRRQQQVALDFAVDRRFRRDVFVRGPAPSTPGAELGPLRDIVIGRLGRPEPISRQARVPRGVIAFQEPFIRDLQTLLRERALTFGDAVTALGAPERSPSEITRNLTFLVAAGELTPFARAGALAPPGAPPARVSLARVLDEAVGTSAERAIPCEVLGNGVPISRLAAVGLQEALGGQRTINSLTARVAERVRQFGGESNVPPTPPRRVAAYVLDELMPTLAALNLLG